MFTTHNKEESEFKFVKELLVQPDICAICDENKFDDRSSPGAPHLIIEILPHNKEYWAAYPSKENVAVFILNKKQTMTTLKFMRGRQHKKCLPEKIDH